MAFSPKLTLVAALLLLAACRSEPVHYHTLMPAHTGSATRSNTVVIEIESLSLPAQVDRPQVVIRQGNSGLVLLESEWWGASLGEEFRSALMDQLANLNPQRKLSLRLDVLRFDSFPGQYGLIDVTWRLRPASEVNDVNDVNGTSLTCRSILQTPSGGTIEDLALAQQNNVKRLAALIGQAAKGTQQSCPPSS